MFNTDTLINKNWFCVIKKTKTLQNVNYGVCMYFFFDAYLQLKLKHSCCGHPVCQYKFSGLLLVNTDVQCLLISIAATVW